MELKLLTFIIEGKYRLGVKTERGIIDVEAAISVVSNKRDIVRTMHEAIEGYRCFLIGPMKCNPLLKKEGVRIL